MSMTYSRFFEGIYSFIFSQQSGLSKIRHAHMSHLRGGEPIGKNRCSGCGLTFGSLDAFDAHRVCSFSRRERRCISISEIQGFGMMQNAKGWWIRNIFNGVTPTSGSENKEEQKEMFAATPTDC